MPTEQKSDVSPREFRVLQITVRADVGGGPRHVYDLLRSLKSSPIHFWIAASDEKPWAPKFKELTRGFYEIPHRRFSVSGLLGLRALIRREHITLIHSHGRGAGLYSRLLGLMTGCPVVHTYHGIHEAPGFGGWLKLTIDRMLSWLPFTAIFVSESERQHARRARVIRGQPESLLLNAVDLERFPLRTSPLAANPIHVGAFLRGDFVKGPDLLLACARGALQHGLPLQFEVAGLSTEELARFGEIPANLKGRGRSNDPAQWLLGLDLFVSAARSEGLPLGVLEAMAAQCPCLLSDIDAHRNFGTHGAMLFNPFDPDDFVQKLKTLMGSVQLRTELAQAGRRAIEAHHSLERFATQLSKIYEATGR